MASLDQMKKEQLPPEEEQEVVEDVPVSADQVELVTRLGIKLLKEGGGLDTLGKAIQQSQDPAQVVGQFMVQLIGSLIEQLKEQIDLDPRVFLVPDGFLDNILDFLEDQLSLPSEFSDQVEGEVLEMIKALAMGEQQPQQQQGPGLDQMGQQAQPAAPQGPGLGGM